MADGFRTSNGGLKHHTWDDEVGHRYLHAVYWAYRALIAGDIANAPSTPLEVMFSISVSLVRPLNYKDDCNDGYNDDHNDGCNDDYNEDNNDG